MLLTVTPVTPCGRGAQLSTDIHSVTERFDWGNQSCSRRTTLINSVSDFSSAPEALKRFGAGAPKINMMVCRICYIRHVMVKHL